MESSNKILSDEQFWKAISVLMKNYHAVNKKLSGAKIVDVHCVQNGDEFDVNALPQHDEIASFTSAIPASYPGSVKCSEECLFEILNNKSATALGQYIVCSKLLYKHAYRSSSHIVQVLDFNKYRFDSIPFKSSDRFDPKHSFSVCCQNGELNVKLLDQEANIEKNSRCLNWLQFVLKPKLIKWSQSSFKDVPNQNVKSLSLVDLEEYTKLYGILKEKYGQDMVNRWTETTDPLKFVYEDVAIATYLILLWRTLNDTPKQFVDMGCGNGLLVHILNAEGYIGYGIDLRKRKIWDIYPETTKLKEQTIIPNDYDAYNDVDWIIGNHSDELSPWIPVMAAMSSYYTKYFLLPCCAYEFSGRKFQRRSSAVSVYNDFLSYVREISIKCKFKTDIDRLKIPSTKRVALVGSHRLYSEDEYQAIRQEISEFVEIEIQQNTNSTELKIRVKEEPVRNCTKVDRNIIDRIVICIFGFILNDDNHDERNEKWRTGRTVNLRELSMHLSKENLKQIKSECGGLKTLIKNKHEIFEVIGDKVKLRYPRKRNERPIGFQYKRRPCFYFLYHPDGCPLTATECTFVHE